MIEELFYKIVQHARVHELIPGYTIQLRLHVLSFKNYMSFCGEVLHVPLWHKRPWSYIGSTSRTPPSTRRATMATRTEHMLGSTNYKSSWDSLHRVYTTLGQVTVVHSEATTNTPDMTWEEIMQRHGRHTTGYTVLTKAEIDTLLQSRRITNIFRKDRRHIIVDSSVQDAVNTAAFDVSMGYMQVHSDE